MVVYLNNDGIASSLTEGNLKASAVWTFGVPWLESAGLDGNRSANITNYLLNLIGRGVFLV